MTKDNYLKELENLLMKKQVNNTYSILREYSNKIDDLLADNRSMEDIITIIGKPTDIVSHYSADIKEDDKAEDNHQEKSYDNDDNIYENGQFKENKYDFINDFSNQYKKSGISDPENTKKILKIVIIVLVFIALFKFAFGSAYYGMRMGHMAFSGSLPLLLFVGAVAYILYVNNKK